MAPRPHDPPSAGPPGGGLRSVALRIVAVGALWLVLLRQAPAVTRDGVLLDPAERRLAALGGDTERVTVVAAYALPDADAATMVSLKGDATRTAARVARALGVSDWRLGNRAELGVRAVFLDGRARGGSQVRVVAWHYQGRRGTAVVLVQTGPLPSLAATRWRLARTVAGALGVWPSAIETAVEVRGFVPGPVPPDPMLPDPEPPGPGRPPVWEPAVEIVPASRGSRVIVGSVTLGAVDREILAEVVW